MKHNIYKLLKNQIKIIADDLSFDDKPARREILNNCLDQLIKDDLSIATNQDKISEKQSKLYQKWLTDYVIKRHKK